MASCRSISLKHVLVLGQQRLSILSWTVICSHSCTISTISTSLIEDFFMTVHALLQPANTNNLPQRQGFLLEFPPSPNLLPRFRCLTIPSLPFQDKQRPQHRLPPGPSHPPLPLLTPSTAPLTSPTPLTPSQKASSPLSNDPLPPSCAAFLSLQQKKPH